MSSKVVVLFRLSCMLLSVVPSTVSSRCYDLKACAAEPVSVSDKTGISVCYESNYTDLCMTTSCKPFYRCVCSPGYCGDTCDHTCHKIFLFGGQSAASDHEASMMMHDVELGLIHRLADMPVGRSYLAGAALGDKVYAIGGCVVARCDSAVSAVHMFDPAGNYWTTAPSLNTARYAHGAVVAGGKIYVVGGYTGSAFLSSVEVYENNKWTIFGRGLSIAREGAGVAVISETDGLYAFGGNNGAFLATVEKMNFHSGNWGPVANMQEARHYPCSAVVGGKIYAMGGRNDDGYLKLVESYDPVTDQWTLVAPMKHARYVCSAATFGGLVYVVGGFDGSSYVDSIEIYNPATDTWAVGSSNPSFARWLAAIAQV